MTEVNFETAAEQEKDKDPQPDILVKDLVYKVPSKTILKGISLQVNRGEILCVMGMSGCGKTSLLHCLGGLVSPTSGEIYIRGKQIVGMGENDLNVVREDMGVVFQYAALFDSMSVFENVAFGLRRRGTKRTEDEIAKIVDDKLHVAAVPGTQHLFPSELSGGMQKRVGLARALAIDPKILLYDEPTSGLDPIVATVIDELIVSTRKKLGVTSVVVSHNIPSVFRIADRIAMMNAGELVAFGTPDEFRNCDNPMVRQFVEGKADGPLQAT